MLAVNNYNKYAAPQVSKARDYTSSQWEQQGLPHLRKAQDAAQQAYDQNLAPHVQRASEIATPYYETAKDNVLNVHEKHIIPAFALSQPHLQAAFAHMQKFFFGKVVPSAQYAWTNAVIFVDGTLWPLVKGIYNDNVRPQLVMIGERIAKYQEGRKLQSAMEEVDNTRTSSQAPTTTEQETAIVSESTTTSTIAIDEVASTTSTSSTPEPRVATDETITEDLVKWQKKFAVAADKGTDDLRERIEEIIRGMTKSDLPEGQGLATALEKTAEVELGSIKARINAIAATLPENAESSEITAAETEIVQAVRDAGAKIKKRAQNMRTWTTTFKYDLKHRSETATDSTLQVLDDIRDLGLQEIGMRWAWMEGVTYKHWQKYHDLKKKFADWRSEVRETALTNPVIIEVQEQADKLLEESMAVTEDAAKELIRLRDVAKWKVAARDATDNFDTRAIPVVSAAVSKASAVAGDIKGAVVGNSQGTDGSASIDASSAASALSGSASSAAFGSTGTAGTALADASSSAASALSSASSTAAVALSDASAAVIGSSTGSAESLASALSAGASSQYSSASSFASSATAGPSEGVLSSGSSIADSISSSASSAMGSASASAKFQDSIDNAGGKVADFTSSLLSDV